MPSLADNVSAHPRRTHSRASNDTHEKNDRNEELKDVGASRDEQTYRRLKNRHIQLIGIGGTIGTALFVQIGRTLMKGGPASLFIAFSFW